MPPKSSSLPSLFPIYLGMMPLAEQQQLLITDRLCQDWRDPLLQGNARLRRRVLPRRVRTRARRDQAKQGDPPYRSGRWPERQKIKCVPRDTFVIGGYGGATVTGAFDRLLLAAKKGAELVRCRMEHGIRAASRASRHHAGDPPASCAETKGRAISATYSCR